MSNDPKPLSKPYLATDMDYLKQYRVQTWNDAQGGGDEAEYSELMKPYSYDEDEPDDYSFWEWTWPGMDWPDIPGITYPDPGECEADEDCTSAQIFGPGQLKCGSAATYSQFHQWIGCEIAPWWAAYGSWEFESHDPDHVQMVSSGPVMATISADSVASSGVSTLTYNGPLNCVDSISIVITCQECCQEFTVSGDAVVEPGDDWVGTISPACPNASCSVVSNSGCELTCSVNAAGSQVTVPTTGMCGSATVTVTDENAGGECTLNQGSATFRINSGSWTVIDYESGGGCPGPVGGPCFNNCTGYLDCPGTPAIYDGKYKIGSGGSCSTAAQFLVRGCPPSAGPYYCDGATSNEPDPGGFCPTGSYPSTVCSGYPCECFKYWWEQCEWKCTC